MPTWIIEPRDPLIVRDGKPFGPSPGARAKTLDFPFPSTTTGGVRTRAGLNKDGIFDTSKIARVKEIAVCGPLLVEMTHDSNDIATWLVQAPADALLLETDQPSCARRKRLVPITIEGDNYKTNLPDTMLLVGQVRHDAGKPSKQAPKYWYWERFVAWLKATVYDDEVAFDKLGHNGPVQESRMHVKIVPETQTTKQAKKAPNTEEDMQASEEGTLFQTYGLEFRHVCTEKNDVDQKGNDNDDEKKRQREREKRYSTLRNTKRLALAVATANEDVRGGIAALGGERRLMCWRESGTAFPTCPSDLVAQIQHFKACRVVLLTPAHFEHGWKPTWLLQECEGVKPTLIAVAIQRPQVVSGWDLEQHKPKPTRRLAPAGSVFFLKLDGTEEAITKWVDAIWMHNISDDEQSRKDGFGLAVVGVWDASYRKCR